MGGRNPTPGRALWLAAALAGCGDGQVGGAAGGSRPGLGRQCAGKGSLRPGEPEPPPTTDGKRYRGTPSRPRDQVVTADRV